MKKLPNFKPPSARALVAQMGGECDKLVKSLASKLVQSEYKFALGRKAALFWAMRDC